MEVLGEEAVEIMPQSDDCDRKQYQDSGPRSAVKSMAEEESSRSTEEPFPKWILAIPDFSSGLDFGDIPSTIYLHKTERITLRKKYRKKRN